MTKIARMSSRRAFNRVVSQARRVAFVLVKHEVADSFPKGWRLGIMVGWGIVILKLDGKSADASKLTRRQRSAALLAADFLDTFGAGNEVIFGTAVEMTELREHLEEFA